MEWSLLAVVIAIAAMLIIFVVVLPLTFKATGLADVNQALGLPEGSVRAIIALALIALFAVTPLVLFSAVDGKSVEVPGLNEQERNLFLENNKAFAPVYAVKTSDEVKGTDGKVTKPSTYTGHLSTKVSDGALDFAKQLLGLISTLATAVTAFYFGAKVAGTASAQGAQQASPPPPSTPALAMKGFSADPASVIRKSDGSVEFILHINGSNMNAIQWIKLTAGSGSSLETSKFVAKSNDLEATAQVLFKPVSGVGTTWTISALNSSGVELATLPDKIVF